MEQASCTSQSTLPMSGSLWCMVDRMTGQTDILLAEGPRRCVVHRGAFQTLDVTQWWETVAQSGEGWRQNDIRVFGQWHKEPRLTAWWGPSYQYATVQWPARQWDGPLETLARDVQQCVGATYNSVLVNGYRNGHDAMCWHRDNKPEIDSSSIASLSLGGCRTVKLSDRRTS